MSELHRTSRRQRTFRFGIGSNEHLEWFVQRRRAAPNHHRFTGRLQVQTLSPRGLIFIGFEVVGCWKNQSNRFEGFDHVDESFCRIRRDQFASLDNDLFQTGVIKLLIDVFFENDRVTTVDQIENNLENLVFFGFAFKQRIPLGLSFLSPRHDDQKFIVF